MKKVKLNEDTCIGCGACCGIAPETVTFGDEHAEVIKEEVTPAAEEAANCCPVGAITIEEED